MAQRGCSSILIGDHVRSYILPGCSDSDYITGTVVGSCAIAGEPRLIVKAVSRTTHGQEDPCTRLFFEPPGCVVPAGALKPTLHRVA